MVNVTFPPLHHRSQKGIHDRATEGHMGNPFLVASSSNIPMASFPTRVGPVDDGDRVKGWPFCG